MTSSSASQQASLGDVLSILSTAVTSELSPKIDRDGRDVLIEWLKTYDGKSMGLASCQYAVIATGVAATLTRIIVAIGAGGKISAPDQRFLDNWLAGLRYRDINYKAYPEGVE